jgi:hypothetical protein
MVALAAAGAAATTGFAGPAIASAGCGAGAFQGHSGPVRQSNITSANRTNRIPVFRPLVI